MVERGQAVAWFAYNERSIVITVNLPSNFHGYSDRETIIGPVGAVRPGEITIRPIDLARVAFPATTEPLPRRPRLDSFARGS